MISETVDFARQHSERFPPFSVVIELENIVYAGRERAQQAFHSLRDQVEKLHNP